jgi:hypothetical protein
MTRYLRRRGLLDDDGERDAAQEGAGRRMRETLADYVRPSVLVVDEVGYLAYGDDAANVLYHVVNDRHLRRRAVVFTTNKHPKRWGHALHDEDLAGAIVDRILERGRLLRLDGPSIRTKHLPGDELAGDDLDDSNDRRVSGTDAAEIPERTARFEYILRPAVAQDRRRRKRDLERSWSTTSATCGGTALRLPAGAPSGAVLGTAPWRLGSGFRFSHCRSRLARATRAPRAAGVWRSSRVRATPSCSPMARPSPRSRVATRAW